MEEERELISPYDEASDGHQEIASLFEQTILLVGQCLIQWPIRDVSMY